MLEQGEKRREKEAVEAVGLLAFLVGELILEYQLFSSCGAEEGVSKASVGCAWQLGVSIELGVFGGFIRGGLLFGVFGIVCSIGNRGKKSSGVMGRGVLGGSAMAVVEHSMRALREEEAVRFLRECLGGKNSGMGRSLFMAALCAMYMFCATFVFIYFCPRIELRFFPDFPSGHEVRAFVFLVHHLYRNVYRVFNWWTKYH
jgi:hypothetical protein